MRNSANASRLPSVDASRSDDFVEYAIRRSDSLYRSGVGAVVIEWDQAEPVPSPAGVLITEHRPTGSEQYKFEMRQGERFARSLPAGDYTVAVVAAGFEPFRAQVQVARDQMATVKVRLEKRRRESPSFAERLRKYGLDLARINPRDISVGEGQQLTLDAQKPDNKRDIQPVTLKTLGEVKAVLGHADDHWPGELSRFGNLAPAAPPKEGSQQPSEEETRQHSFDARAALREYVYGNSKSVSRWEGFLSDLVALDPINIGMFVFNVVTVGPGAVLQVGAGGLSCDTLRVHLTGTLQVVGNGPTKIETGTYEAFA